MTGGNGSPGAPHAVKVPAVRRAPALLLTGLPALAAFAFAAPAAAQGTPDARPGPAAVFWGGGRTWYFEVSPVGPRLRVADGLLALAPDGELIRLRRRVETHRRAGGGDAVLPPPASRRTLWEQARTPERRWQPGPWSAAPFPEGAAASTTARQNEQAILQFTGETASVGIFDRVSFATEAARTVQTTESASTVSLLDAAAPAVVAPDAADAALAWLQAHLPDLLGPCAARVTGTVTLEGPEGLKTTYVVAAPAPANAAAAATPACREPARLLALAPIAAPGPLVSHTSLPPGVLDRRSAPEGAATLLLLGEAPAPELRPPLRALADPCVGFELRAEVGGVSTAIGTVPALDGLRWVTSDSPWRRWAATVFTVPGGCTQALGEVAPGPVQLDGDLSDWPADAFPLAAPLCRLYESGRAWGGPTDLSGAAAFRTSGEMVTIAVDVKDLEAASGDLLRLLTTSGDLTVDRAGRVETGGDLRAERVQAEVKVRASGYSVELRLPRAALGSPPALAVAIDDVDPADAKTPAGSGLRLWLAGEPVGQAGQTGQSGGRPVLLRGLP